MKHSLATRLTRMGLKRWIGFIVVIVIILSLIGRYGEFPLWFDRWFFPQPITAVLHPSFQLDGSGLNIDSIAVWEAPDPQDTLLFVTARDNSLVEIWQFPFVDGEQQPLTHESFGTAQVNGVAVDQDNDVLFVSIASPASTVAVFALPSLELTHTLVDQQTDLGIEPGITFYHEARNGIEQTIIYVSSDGDQSVHIYNADTGAKITAVPISTELETIVVDALYEVVYIPDETGELGILAYNPDLSPYLGDGRNSFGGGLFQNDAEGMVIYTCLMNGRDNGQGFLVVADQRPLETDFEFFDRQTWQHRGTLRLAGVNNSDGLGSTQISLPGYPSGLLAAIDDDREVVGIGWDAVLGAMQLSCQ